MKTHISGHCIVGAAAVLLFLLPNTSFTQDKPVTDQTLLNQISDPGHDGSILCRPG